MEVKSVGQLLLHPNKFHIPCFHRADKLRFGFDVVLGKVHSSLGVAHSQKHCRLLPLGQMGLCLAEHVMLFLELARGCVIDNVILLFHSEVDVSQRINVEKLNMLLCLTCLFSCFPLFFRSLSFDLRLFTLA